MMGHKKIETTAHYARANKAVIGRDMKLLEEKISSIETVSGV